jgi:membrane-associated phospholipid phosphatase
LAARLGLGSAGSFALLAAAYASGSPTVQIDARLADALHANAVPAVTTVFTAVTLLGSTPALALVGGGACAYLLIRRQPRNAVLPVLALLGAQLLGWSLKALFARPRPTFDDPLATADWFSFPSGHAMSSAALYGALASVFADRPASGRTRAAGLGGAGLLVAAIGFSRLYLGVHYLTDVLAGYSAGLALLLLAIAGLRPRR